MSAGLEITPTHKSTQFITPNCAQHTPACISAFSARARRVQPSFGQLSHYPTGAAVASPQTGGGGARQPGQAPREGRRVLWPCRRIGSLLRSRPGQMTKCDGWALNRGWVWRLNSQSGCGECLKSGFKLSAMRKIGMSVDQTKHALGLTGIMAEIYIFRAILNFV